MGSEVSDVANDATPLKVGALFAGYGGLELAISQVFPDTQLAWYSEIDRNASRILQARFTHAVNVGDIAAVDWAAVAPVDILTGGFPCQDVSHAGLRAGITPKTRSGLWHHMAKALEFLAPGLVVIENVSGIRSAAAVSSVEPCPWCLGDDPNGHMRALGTVLADLAALGFNAEWISVRASDVGAAHRRERVFIVATDADGRRHKQRLGTHIGAVPEPSHGDHPRSQESDVALFPTPQARDHKDQCVDNAGCHRPGDTDSVPRAVRDLPDTDFGPYTAAIARWATVVGRPAPAPTKPGQNGRPRLSPAFVEWLMGLPDGWVTGVDIPRSAQLKCLGNGVVPLQAAHAINIALQRLQDGAPCPA